MRKLAVISGGTSGIGLAAARSLLGKNFDLLLLYRDRHAHAEASRRSLMLSQLARVEILGVDITVSGAQEKIQSRLKTFDSPPEVLINAAGYSLERLFLRTADNEIDDLINTHVSGTLKLTRLILQEMYRFRSGCIINISSSAVKAKYGVVAYATAKAAVETFTQSLASEVFGRGITVNALRPCLISDSSTPLPGTVSMRAVIEQIEFLISAAGAKTTGMVINLDHEN
jgi:short-subunit dehydrogenase